jgi:antitoxin VapB
MATARVFKSGNSQAVRLPKEFRVHSAEVEIFRRGDEIVLREKPRGMARAFELIANLDIDCDAIEALKREPPQERDFELDPEDLGVGPKRKRSPKRKRA